ncbi:MAG: hypothetical protein A3C46_00980 [Deltaproteobacteria bacterium RIFCSPHIGHO2_02_FULL_44_16]|nr:MAG: hypothetical protein A3C46_00980 [Deltaproteobacteria bacterium RIFCSPHIGHO2_02_FULL_44_16]
MVCRTEVHFLSLLLPASCGPDPDECIPPMIGFNHCKTDASTEEEKKPPVLDASKRADVGDVDVITPDAGGLDPLDSGMPDSSVMDAGTSSTSYGLFFTPLTPKPAWCDFPASMNASRNENFESLSLYCPSPDGYRVSAMDMRGGRPSIWSTRTATVPGTGSNHLDLPDGNQVVTFTAGTDGFAIVSSEGEIQPIHPTWFGNLTITSTAGIITAPSTFPSGIALADRDLGFSMSNFFPPSHYAKSGLIIYFAYENGSVDTERAYALFPSGSNTTGLADYNGDFISLSSNVHFPMVGRGAFLDRLRPETGERVCSVGPLTDLQDRPITAQVSPHLEVTPDGVALVSWSGQSSGIMFIDVNTCTVVRKESLDGIAGRFSFISSTISYCFGDNNCRAILVDFGGMPEAAAVIVVDMREEGRQPVLYQPLPNVTYAGPAAALGNSVVVAVDTQLRVAPLHLLR